MKVLEKIRKVIDLILSSACAIVFAVMVVVGTYQVVVRYFFNSPSTVSEELLTYSFSWMALLSSALVFGKRDHMRMGFIADKLTGVRRRSWRIVIELMIMAFFCQRYDMGRLYHYAAFHDPGYSFFRHTNGRGIYRGSPFRCSDRNLFGPEYH